MPPVTAISTIQSYQMQTLDTMGQGTNINKMSTAQLVSLKWCRISIKRNESGFMIMFLESFH